MRLSKKIALVLAILCTVAIWVALAVLAEAHYSIYPGSTAEFWTSFTRFGVSDLGNAYRENFVSVRHGKCFYAPLGCYPPSYLVIDESAVHADLPRIAMELEARIAAKDPDDFIAEGYRRWRALPPSQQRGIAGLFERTLDAQKDQFRANPKRDPDYLPEPGSALERHEQVLRKADRYRLTIAFEGLWLSGVVWLGCLPWLANRGAVAKVFAIALLPLLFYLPQWFAYARHRNGPWYRDHTIIYRPLVDATGPALELADWEIRFLDMFPPALEPIVQGNARRYVEEIQRREGLHGPVDVFLRTLPAAIFGACLVLAEHLLNRRPRQGFPVLQ